MKRLLLLSCTAGLLACGGGSKSDTAATANPCGANPCGANPCGPNPCGANPCGANPCGGEGDGAGMDVGVDWTGWQSWTKVNAEHAEAYAALTGEMPQGFAVVKAVHADADGAAGDVQMLTVMAKMGPDYDRDNGNWYYAAMSADGSKVMNEGKIEMCINCHASGKDQLFGAK